MRLMVVTAPESGLKSRRAAGRRSRRDDDAVLDADPEILLERFGRLPAGRLLLERLRGAPSAVYLVGGAVRDLILQIEPRELDLVIETELDPLIELLGASGTLHDRFGTANLELDGHSYDVARARSETYSRPGALPTVAAADLDEDLWRRDFTVNAIALGVWGPPRGELIALYPALDDLRARMIRVLHDGSFIDDPTRLFRLALYSSRLRFTIEPHTFELARAAIAVGALETVSGPRIGAELRRLAAEPDPVSAVGALGPLGIDGALAAGFGLRDPEAARRALELLPPDGNPATVVLAAAAIDVGTAELGRALDEWAFERAQRDAIMAAAGRARPLAAALQGARTPSQVAAAVGGSGVETVALAGAFGAADAARRWLSDLRHVKLEIDGRDLLAAGVEAGPAVGEGLRAALAAKLDGHADGRAAELDQALRAAAPRPSSLDADGADDVDPGRDS
jgi:tRNA nucleotidyltransferase (CCA-adding enzyme)